MYSCQFSPFHLSLFYVFGCPYTELMLGVYILMTVKLSSFIILPSYYVLFTFFYALCFKVCFVWYKYCDSCFLVIFVISVYKKYLYLFPCFESVCVCLPLSWSLEEIYYRLSLFFCFLTQSSTICLLIGAFSPSTF